MTSTKSVNLSKNNNCRHQQPLRVGFDMDGVLLYNPARIIRPIVSFLKNKKSVKRKQLRFFEPQTAWQKFFWQLFHKSSIFVAPGLDEAAALVKQNKIEAYLITGRFNHLKKDFEKWQHKLKTKKVFKDVFLNENNEQPHLFKQRIIKELKLDIFVEDNWDIVNYLQSSQTNKTAKRFKVFWIYNFIDRKIEHQHKFPNLKQAIQVIKKHLENKP